VSIQGDIKKAVFDALSGITAGRAYFGEARPDVGLPNIVYRIDDTSYSVDASSMDERFRTFRLRVEIRNELYDNSVWELDELCYSVEAALWDPPFSGLAKDFRLTRVEYEHDDLDEDYGICRLSYEGWF